MLDAAVKGASDGITKPNAATINIPLPAHAIRMQAVADNPVACAQVYERTMDSVLKYLFGIEPSHKTRKSPPPMSARKCGLFGKMIAYFAVHEGQESKRLHMHALAWTDISPSLIQRMLDQPEAMHRICQRIDSMVRAFVEH